MAIGYACLTVGVTHTDISRCILKNATEPKLRQIILSNLTALDTMIDYNIDNDIRLFRIGSDMIPFASHRVNDIRWWEDYKDVFHRIGTKIKLAGIRVSMHPGQYTVLNSLDERVVKNAVRELEYHARFLDTLRADQSGKLILHIGGVYGDKELAMRQFVENYFKLSDSITKRLVIENDDKNYNIQEVLDISAITGAPVVFDNLHHKVNSPTKLQPEMEWLQACTQTWRKEDGKQKIHYSQQKKDRPAGAHSETIDSKEFLEFYKKLPDQEIAIMLEVKDKNLSAVKCRNIIERNTMEGNNISSNLKQEWDRYELFLFSRSPILFSKAKDVMQEEAVIPFYEYIEKALSLPMDRDAEITTAIHIWEIYYQKDCTSTEKNRFEKLLRECKDANGSIKSLKNHLLKCAKRRDITNLINSLYFYLD